MALGIKKGGAGACKAAQRGGVGDTGPGGCRGAGLGLPLRDFGRRGNLRLLLFPKVSIFVKRGKKERIKQAVHL